MNKKEELTEEQKAEIEKKQKEEEKEQERKDAREVMKMILQGSQEAVQEQQTQAKQNELLASIDPKVFDAMESDTVELKETKSTLRQVYD